ncbi:MAG: flagellar motor protein [Nitrospiraceae bacterium]|nr:MAG: flagellar motor protein [Nitrospiraceae bacterium]
MNKASTLGIVLALGAVVGGNVLEGGSVDSILQGSAALIVFGGTLGATFLSFSIKDISLSARLLKQVFIDERSIPENHTVIADMVDLSHKARQKGILSLEGELGRIRYGFFRRALKLVIDGIDPRVVAGSLEQENRTFELEQGRAARVFEAAGGYAPTIGIIGAVLGLIHVMENLSDPANLGSGIAVAFVATVYGVASANLLFLPIAKKMVNSVKEEIQLREMIIEGVLGIQEGKSPFVLREHLSSFLSGS